MYIRYTSTFLAMYFLNEYIFSNNIYSSYFRYDIHLKINVFLHRKDFSTQSLCPSRLSFTWGRLFQYGTANKICSVSSRSRSRALLTENSCLISSHVICVLTCHVMSSIPSQSTLHWYSIGVTLKLARVLLFRTQTDINIFTSVAWCLSKYCFVSQLQALQRTTPRALESSLTTCLYVVAVASQDDGKPVSGIPASGFRSLLSHQEPTLNHKSHIPKRIYKTRIYLVRYKLSQESIQKYEGISNVSIPIDWQKAAVDVSFSNKVQITICLRSDIINIINKLYSER